MKSEYEQEAKDLIRKLRKTTEVFSEMYKQLKNTLYFQLLTMFALLSFIFLSLVVPNETMLKFSYMIIPLVILNYTLAILHRNTLKKRMEKIHKDGIEYMGRLSDIVDWTSVRNRYLNKDNERVIDSITSFIHVIEKPLSPFRHSYNYFRLLLYLSCVTSVLVTIYYVVYCLSLIDVCDYYFRTLLNWLD